jgi:hypothetical protein
MGTVCCLGQVVVRSACREMVVAVVVRRTGGAWEGVENGWGLYLVCFTVV